VQSAQEIQTQFGGEVPEAQLHLQMLTGIGPVMGDLLAFVNTPVMHLSRTTHAAEAAALDRNEAKIDPISHEFKLHLKPFLECIQQAYPTFIVQAGIREFKTLINTEYNEARASSCELRE
jgi:hypothetical protein